jgi:hypothetical protein
MMEFCCQETIAPLTETYGLTEAMAQYRRPAALFGGGRFS